ncbi:MAG TPA: DbpA RNA binding domain-containing protein [Longimicrobium sp.]|nr:DbpA RNA binding domain-containing protein [Longimicrobium sp.]
MASFNDLGLREPLLAALEEEGIERPTALQQAAIPVLRREGNLVARSASGAGKTLAYGLGVLDRIEARAEAEEADDEAGDEAVGGARVLVLTASTRHAERATMELVPYAQAVGLTVTSSGRGWGTAPAAADVLVATPAEVLEAVRTSGVKLETLEAIIVDGASEIEALGGWDATETLFDHVPRGAQRVLFTAETSAAVEDLVDRRIKRGLRYPPVPAMPDEQPAALTGVVGYVIVSEREKVETVARLLGGDRDGDAPPILVCRGEERAADIAEALALRGFMAGDVDDEDVDVAVISWGMEPEELAARVGAHPATVISFDVPADETTLRALHGGGMTGFVLVLPREVAHLRHIAGRALLDARPAGMTDDEPVGRNEVTAFRDTIRRAMTVEDLGAQILVLEPLFEDFAPAEVAAAIAALLRRKPAAAPAAPSAGPTARAATEPDRTAGTATSAYARLYVGVGERDGVRAGDLVGAIAGETNIPGSQVGKIEVRDTFSIVEVPAELAEKVIAAVNGITIKGRATRVDFDRGNSRRAGAPGTGGTAAGMRRRDRGDAPSRPRERNEGSRPERGGGDTGGFRPPTNRRPTRDE